MSEPLHPAVVLRSSYVHLRALLAVALIAIVGLSAAVVVLATRDDSGGATGAAVHGPSVIDTTRYDGGPNEGTAGH